MMIAKRRFVLNGNSYRIGDEVPESEVDDAMFRHLGECGALDVIGIPELTDMLEDDETVMPSMPDDDEDADDTEEAGDADDDEDADDTEEAGDADDDGDVPSVPELPETDGTDAVIDTPKPKGRARK